MSLQETLEQIAAGLPSGKIGFYVKHVESGAEWAVEPDSRFPLASVLKVPVLVEFFRQEREGLLRRDERMEVTPVRKSPGGGLLKELDPGLAPTLMDLALLMIIRSDNTATDMVIERIGLENVNKAMDRLGLHQTRVTMDCRILLYNCYGLARPGEPLEASVPPWDQLSKEGLRDDGAVAYSDSLENDVGTPRELGILLEYILKGEAFDPVSSEAALGVLKRQQLNERIPKLLPEGTVVAHKTGSIWGVHTTLG
jgi:beta-lactamase class A